MFQTFFHIAECSTSELLFCLPGINVNGLTENDIHDFSPSSFHFADGNLDDLMESVKINSSAHSLNMVQDDSKSPIESCNESEIDEVDKEFEARIF